MGRISNVERITRGLLHHYLPDIEMAYNIRPTLKDGAKPWQKSQARMYGIDLDGLEGDIYIPAWNTIIEVMGEQHYRNIDYFTGGDLDKHMRQLERDSRKIDLCQRQGITLYHCTVFDLLPYRWEPFIKHLMKDHGRLEQFHRTTPPRVLFAQADKLSRSKVTTKQVQPLDRPGLIPRLQRMWRHHKQHQKGQSRRVYG